jgi:hypothetical protein
VPAAADTVGESPFERAANRARDAAKWLIAAYAAVGAALAAGIQVSNIGRIGGDDPRLWLALAGLVVAILAIAVAIGRVSRVLVSRPLTLPDLATKPDKEIATVRNLVEGNRTIVGDQKLTEINDIYAKARADQMRVVVKQNRDEPVSDEELAAAQNANEAVDDLRTAVDDTMAVASYLQVTTAFERARPWLLSMAILTALGIVVFAAAANPAPRQPARQPAAVAAPSQATVVLSSDGRALLGERLGSGCDTWRLRVIVLAATPSGLDVVSVPGGGCAAVRFSLPHRTGKLAR